MVLAESSPERMTFRFRGRIWGWLTLVVGAALIGGCAWGFLIVGARATGSLAVVAAFGLLFLYASLYSFTADQLLVVDGSRHSVRFHKKSLYGKVDWERGGDQFEQIIVVRARAPRGRAMNWAIALVGLDGGQLFIGENELGSLHHEHALTMATRVGRLAGIKVVDIGG